MRTPDEVDRALSLRRRGLTPTDAACATGIPRSTIRDWSNGRLPQRARSPCPLDDPSRLDATAYAYLLGLYLGDGYISPCPRSVWRLRITLDAIYPRIVAECATAMREVRSGIVHVGTRRNDRAVDVSSYWKHWPCLLPQHGKGRKHTRPIVLADWQQRIVTLYVEPFLRGLIHSDGTRIIATERKGHYVRRAPRYAFSNHSEDILQLFRAACDSAGIHCTRASRKQIAIYRKADVARLDEFVGAKE